MSITKRNKWGLKRRLSHAIKDINDERSGEYITGDGELMKIHLIIGESTNSKLRVSASGATGCTAGLIFPSPIKDHEITAPEKVLYITSELPNKTVRMFLDKTGNHKQARDFYHWLFNDSPYSRAFVVKSVDKVVDIGRVIVRTDLDHRIVAEAMMCTRYIWESWCKNYCVLFSKLLNAGVSGNMAFQMTYFIKASGGSSFIQCTTWGHSAPQSNMNNSNTLARFVCVGHMLNHDFNGEMNCLNNYVFRPYNDGELYGWYLESGHDHNTKKLTFKNVGGFLSGQVSKGWGKHYKKGEGFDVFSYLNKILSNLKPKEEASCNLFQVAWDNLANDSDEDKFNLDGENLTKFAFALNNLEKHLRDGTTPEDV